MDNLLENTMREMTARRDERLPGRMTIPVERLETLRGVVSNTQSAAPRTLPRAGWFAAVRQYMAAFDGPRVGVATAAACLLLATSIFVSLQRNATRSDTAQNDPPLSINSRPHDEDLFGHRSAGNALRLRLGAAELAHLQTGLLAKHRRFDGDLFQHASLTVSDFGSDVMIDGEIYRTP